MSQENHGIWPVLEKIGLVGGLLSFFSIILGVVIFIADENRRREAEVRQAWQVINTASGKSGSGGRQGALEFLNSEPRRNPWLWETWKRQSLAGLEAPKAFLYQVQLPNAELAGANLRGADLSESNLQRAKFWNANLQGAILTEANLQGADLRRVDLQGANLSSVDLSGAQLKDNQQKGDQDKANLQGAKYTDEKTPEDVCTRYLINHHPCDTKLPKDIDPKKEGMVLLRQ